MLVSRPSQIYSANPEILRIFEDLKTKASVAEKERVAQELKNAYIKYGEYCEEILTKVQKIINSNDSTEKLGGIIAVDVLSTAIQETQVITFVNKFLSVIFQQLNFSSDLSILKKTSEVFGKLVKMGDTKIAQIIEADVEESFKWIKGDNVKEHKKYAAILSLKELLVQAPFLSFNKIFTNSDQFQLLWNLIREKKYSVREAALDFMNEAIKQFSQRELDNQKYWLDKIIYSEIKPAKSPNDPDAIHGNIIILKSLLSYAKKEIFIVHIEEISEYIFMHRNSKTPYIQLSVIETIPILARFNSGVFVSKYIEKSINFLLNFGSSSKASKEKAICYDTLANIFEPLDFSCMKEFLPNILKTIMTELDKKHKPFCEEIIKCLEVITKKIDKKKITEYMKIDSLVDSILLNGLNTYSLDFLKELSKMDLEKHTEQVQYKLLMTISLILAGKYYPFPQKSSIDLNALAKFQFNLTNEGTTNPEFCSNEAIALSLQALSTFDFEYFSERMALFVKDVVLNYLDHENPKIRKAAAKAGCLLYIRKPQNYGQFTITKSLVNDILEKFLSVCLSDPDEKIQETMLESLNDNFDTFLNSSKTLKKLFLCLNDPSFKVKENSLVIICRLTKLNPSEIIPFLKKKVLQILNDLNVDGYLKEKDKIQIVDLLTCVVKNAEGIIEPHTDAISQTLLKLLKDPNTSHHLIACSLKCLKELSQKVGKALINYLGDFFPLIIQYMQDMLFTAKREMAIQTMTQIIKNTGFVIFPYYKYPNLLDTILFLIRNEIKLETRKELLRLFGALGAIDSFYYKKINQRLSDPQNRLSLDEILVQDFKTTFNISRHIKEFSLKRRSIEELYKFYDDIVILYDIDQKTLNRLGKLTLLQITQTEKKDDLNENNKIIGSEKTTLTSKTADQSQELEELLHSHTVINLNNIDYYTTVTIKALLKVLCNNTLNQFQDLAIDAINYIASTLKSRLSNFLYLIIPVFTYLINNEITLRENLLHHLEKIIKLCGASFSENFIDPVLEIIMKFIDPNTKKINTDPNFKIMSKCFETLNAIITTTNKRYLRHKMELITNKLNQIIRSYESSKEIIRFVFIIYSNLNEMLDFYLDNIITLITKIIVGLIQTDQDTLIRFIGFFDMIVLTCSTSIQYTSKMVHSLLFILDHHPYNENIQKNVVNCFVNMMFKFKNSFLVYLPKVNSYTIRFKNINHKKYKDCIDFLLNYGSLDDFEAINDNNNVAEIPISSYFTTRMQVQSQKSLPDALNSNQQMFSLRPTDNDALLNEFNTLNKNLKEDWIEWMRKSSLELLKQSPYPVLYGCNSVAELYPPIAKELYNIAFVSCWGMLNDRQKEQMISKLNSAIQHPTIPVNILQTILNLAEFMQHDREVIPIDISVLGDLAERCMAYAKALYYRELEFEVSPESTIESLITLYSNLGQSEAANGLLVYAKNTLNIELKMSWYENLQRWEDAYEAYQNNSKTDPNGDEFLVNKMRCLSAMSDWDILLTQCESILDKNQNDEPDKRKQLAHLAATASLHLNQWDKLEVYTNKITEENADKHFLNCILNVKKGKVEESMLYINKLREILDNKVSGLLLESYSRAYENIVKLQQLTEMEEILDYIQEEQKLLRQDENLRGSPHGKMEQKMNELFTSEYVNPDVVQLKTNLIEKWNDRLNGCCMSIDVWQKILSVRSILFNKYDNLDAWIKFSKICRKEGKYQVCKRTLDLIQNDIKKVVKSDADLPPKFVLANYESEYAMGILNTQEIIEKISNYLDTAKNADHFLKSKYFLKLGLLTKHNRDEISESTIKETLRFYERSIDYQNTNYKAWHSFGLVNFEAVEYYENLDHNTSHDLIIQHTVSALKGFVKAISYGGIQTSSSKTLQDLLRLLTLWFKYGDHYQVSQILTESFKIIDIVSWIEVIPQLIARFDIPNVQIQGLIHTLLMQIGKHHPQALIYPLTVSYKEKSNARRTAAEKILGDMKLHSTNLVTQALLISDELCRTAILLKEQWADGIEEACRFYLQEKNYEVMLKTLLSLHESMRKTPETLSEITFHQCFKWEISEAETWLLRYKKTKDEGCLGQAWDIYHSIFRKISDKLTTLTTVHLENVSPKLLTMKNCDISVPGLYRPNKPIIKIAGFAPKLSVLSSKQHPRKLFVYGSDGKDYHFLLKGHEDIRQDERVMQLFSLCNKLMATEPETSKKDLSITRYSVIPLSTKAGLIGWVQNCDTLQQLIKEHRENFKIIPNIEQKLLQSMCQNYELLPLANKVEIFRFVLDSTKGEDLKKVLWLKSPNSETWLECRTNYTRSLATMSMVGYILGLGDRHPSNIMLQRMTGKIVHIDFGDCFEVAMKREKFPERVPFRLTRMLVRAMEACSIEGTYRNTCEAVMKVLRDNKESLIAVMQAFVYDPLLNWRLLTPSDAVAKAENKPQQGPNIESRKIKGKDVLIEFEELKVEAIDSPKRKEDERNFQSKFAEDEKNRPIEILNQRALEVIERIKKKLSGKDFKEHGSLRVVDQVNNLIKQATSHENICQAYIGWCPFW